MLTLLLTCPYGLVGVLNQELKYLKYKPVDSFDTGTFVQTDRDGLIHLNLRSRVASKIYVQLGETAPCSTFDELYTITYAAPRAERLPGTEFLTVNVHTHQSQLHAPRSIQSIVHKAILTHLNKPGSSDVETGAVTPTENPYEIFCHLERDQVSLYLNTSGTGLHQRGYRIEAGEAPLKENVAAALVLMSGRRRQDALRDPCCGAGTICIEATMIARNIAPGLLRTFAFQQFVNYPQQQFKHIKTESQKKGLTKTYHIFGSDLDPEILEKAKRNAERARVADTIEFKQRNLLEVTDLYPLTSLFVDQTGQMAQPEGLPSMESVTVTHLHLITNPPYGKRLQSTDIKQLYKKIVTLSNDATNHATLITSYPEFSDLLPMRRSRREVTNGPDICYIRQKPKG